MNGVALELREDVRSCSSNSMEVELNRGYSLMFEKLVKIVLDVLH
jgi:hypothetical protein